MKKSCLLPMFAFSVCIARAQFPQQAPLSAASLTSAAHEKLKTQYLAAAQHGDRTAMEKLAFIYYNEKKSSASFAEAVKWFNSAGVAGSGIAWHMLGRIYQLGNRGLQQDFTKSAGYFYKGMQAGEKNSTYMVAYYLYKGLAGKQDYDSACTLFKQLAADGQRNAMYFLGLCYRNGFGTERNAAQANYWLKQAAARQYYQAIDELKQDNPENPVTPLSIPAMNATANSKIQLAPSGNIKGTYKGWAIRYDWSGKHITSMVPLQVQFTNSGNGIAGKWIEGKDTALIRGSFTDNTNLAFTNTQYSKKDHYTKNPSEPWQFTNASLQHLQMADSLYITGNIHVYSPKRKEPGQPLYIQLSRVAMPDELNPTVAANKSLTVYPNPFHDQVKVNFELEQSKPVTISLFTMQGQLVTADNAGTLSAGVYTRTIQTPAALAPGSYIVNVTTGTASKQNIVIKQ